jgi:hypothetical protein
MASAKLSAVRTLVENSSSLQQSEKEEILATLRVADVPDTMIYRIVVFALGSAIFIPLIAVLVKDKDTGELLLPLATGALGALAGLLAPSPGG